MTNGHLYSGQFFTDFHWSTPYYVPALTLLLSKKDDFPVSMWTGWLMRMSLGLNVISINYEVSFLDKFSPYTHQWKFSISAEIYQDNLDPHQSKWELSGSLQISLLLRKAFWLYNRHPLVAAGCFWFSCEFLYYHQPTATRVMRIICINAGLKQNTYFFIPLGYISISRSKDWSNIGDARERTEFCSLDNPLPST